MEMTFHCPNCHQELLADAAAAGQTIQCPTCNHEIKVPQPEATALHTGNVIASSAAAKIERHFSVPVHDRPAEVLIEKPKVEEKEPAPDELKKIRFRVIRHTDCIEVGHDRYEEMVAAFLNKIGEANIISITPINYTHIDIATQKILTDYAIQVIYRA
ncbi:MAG TPA: hypothetical protein PKM73_19150 [Verrucomicrobiota bacterium]|nr:hypothetical protein [Verrucomicrobiota bacterium]HNU52416.1 hypothetical protein [Verrucomicrobiota bacterium]